MLFGLLIIATLRGQDGPTSALRGTTVTAPRSSTSIPLSTIRKAYAMSQCGSVPRRACAFIGDSRRVLVPPVWPRPPTARDAPLPAKSRTGSPKGRRSLTAQTHRLANARLAFLRDAPP
ncbi:unnamed protein product, partial [Iphiclides podalirius]